MGVPVKLLADDVWSAEYYKPGFLTVGLDSYGWLYL